MIKNIIWDFDGTLFDTYPAIAKGYQSALRDFGHEVPVEMVDALARVSMDYCIAEITRCFNVDDAAFIERFSVHYEQMAPDASPPFPGVVAVCEKVIKRGGQNFLVTHRRKAGAVELMRYFNMEHLFADCLYGDDDFEHKPNPAMFDYMIEKYNLVRNETLAVGDRELDIAAGKAAGVQTCLFVKLSEELNLANKIIYAFNDLFEKTGN